MITDEQLDDMLHALGKSQTPDRAKMGWRNWYDAGGTSESWEDLITKGLATYDRGFYRVSLEGMRILGVTLK